METFLTKEEWTAHTLAEAAHQTVIKDHAKRIQHVEMAMFGDDLFPETVKNAIMPTMVRLNTVLDTLGTLGRILAAVITTLTALIVAAKALGWI